MRTLTQQVDDEIERVSLLSKSSFNNKVIEYLKKHKDNLRENHDKSNRSS